MSDITAGVERDAAQVLAAFRRVQEESFTDVDFTNPELEVEVIPVGEVPGRFVPQSVVIVITPWMINGMVLPGHDLPSTMPVGNTARPLIAMELPETGPYTQVTLISDVSGYSSQVQARTIAQSMVPVLLAGIATNPAE